MQIWTLEGRLREAKVTTMDGRDQSAPIVTSRLRPSADGCFFCALLTNPAKQGQCAEAILQFDFLTVAVQDRIRRIGLLCQRRHDKHGD